MVIAGVNTFVSSSVSSIIASTLQVTIRYSHKNISLNLVVAMVCGHSGCSITGGMIHSGISLSYNLSITCNKEGKVSLCLSSV